MLPILELTKRQVMLLTIRVSDHIAGMETSNVRPPEAAFIARSVFWRFVPSSLLLTLDRKLPEVFFADCWLGIKCRFAAE